jgi:hypothetical protein
MGLKLGPSHHGKNRLKVFQNRVLRRIFGPKRDEIIGGSKNLHNEKLHNLYSSPNINDQVKEDEIGRTCSTHEEIGMHVGILWERKK